MMELVLPIFYQRLIYLNFERITIVELLCGASHFVGNTKLFRHQIPNSRRDFAIKEKMLMGFPSMLT